MKAVAYAVKLRDGQFVQVARIPTCAGFSLAGRTKDGNPQLWCQCGHWSDTHRDHPLDIVARITPAGHLVPVGH